MISIKQAYNMATQLTDSKNLDSIRSFPDGYGFVFVIDKKQVQTDNVMIFINKDGKNCAIVPIDFEHQDIIMSGALIPLTTIKQVIS